MRGPVWLLGFTTLLSFPAVAQPAGAVDDAGPAVAAAYASPTVVRPAIVMNRWAEDWSVLADPALQTGALDGGKYIPLSATNPKSYVSLGATLRERWELNAAPGFGVGGAQANRQDSYLLQRFQVHADVHLDEHWRGFIQLEDARAFARRTVGSVDENRLDLRLAFAEYTGMLGSAVVKARLGRQDFQFDLQRFISSRDGPNVRQSFDAVWADWELAPWRVLGFVSRPVQYSFGRAFDDRSNRHFRFSLLRAERQVFGTNELSVYFAEYARDEVRFLDATGDERRHVLDARFAGTAQGFDWDLEAMGQLGEVGASHIRAYAVGTRTGYTFASALWSPRLGLQADMASGDGHAGDGVLGTFNPLFPNGYYFTLAGFTGYANLVHVKPSITVSPASGLKVALAAGLQWRMTTADAIYTQPIVPVAGTAGRGGSWSGVYAQLRADYAFSVNLAGAVEAVRYQVGSAIRQAGGHDASYLGTEFKLSW
jgi:hypothetical protein